MALTLYCPKPRNLPHEGRLNVHKFKEDSSPDFVPDHTSNYPKTFSSPEESDEWLVIFAGYEPGSDLSWCSLFSDKEFSLTTRKLTEGLQSGVYSKALEAMASTEADGQGTLHLLAFRTPPRLQSRQVREEVSVSKRAACSGGLQIHCHQGLRVYLASGWILSFRLINACPDPWLLSFWLFRSSRKTQQHTGLQLGHVLTKTHR